MSEQSNVSAPAESQESTAPVSDDTQDGSSSQEESVEASGQDQQLVDLKDQVKNGSPKEKAAAKKTLNKLKIKFNGKEFDEDLPFEIPDDPKAIEYMQKKLQMERFGRNKAQEHASLEAEVRSFVEELRKNPKAALSNPAIGLDLKKLAQQIIEEEIENSSKSPDQLKAEKLEAELKSLKDEREKEKEDARARDLERLQAQEYERYDTSIKSAIKGSGLPESDYIIKKVADYMLLGLREGLDVNPEDVMPLVKEELNTDLKSMFAVMPDEVIEQLVGKDVFNRVRKKKVANVKAGQPPIPIKAAVKDVGRSSEKKESKDKVSFRKFFGV